MPHDAIERWEWEGGSTAPAPARAAAETGKPPGQQEEAAAHAAAEVSAVELDELAHQPEQHGPDRRLVRDLTTIGVALA